MKTLLLLILSSVCLAETRPPEVWLYQNGDSFFWVIQRYPVHITDNFQFTCARGEVLAQDDDGCLEYITRNWLDPNSCVNLERWAQLANGWTVHHEPIIEPIVEPKSVVDPNSVDPIFIVYFTATGSKYHTESHYETAVPVSIVEALKLGLEPCSICKPLLYKETEE
jgi:hypothetical protein